MTDYQTISEILNETVFALCTFDVAKLQSLERQIGEFADTPIKVDREGATLIMQQKSLLEILLQNCEANLKTLNRLRDRNVRDPWAR